MKKLVLLCLAAFCVFTLSVGVTKVVYAADSSNGIVTYQGVLEKHTNPKYTHKLAGQKVNFILNGYYTAWEGKEVVVKVKFNEGKPGFRVLSITLAQNNSNPSKTAVFQGILVKHSNSKYTHKLKGQNVNFILSSDYNHFEGKEVKVEVQFTGKSSGAFRVVSFKEV